MDKIILKNRDLSVSILPPGSVYKRSRFDWTGIVEQVSMGDIQFLGTEAGGSYSGTEGIGLSTEFGIETPLSYWKTLPGKTFLKIGIGRLKRKSLKAYSFFDDYEVEPFDTEVKQQDNRVDFIQKNCRCGSYSYDYIKSVTIEKNSLLISCYLRNTGKSTIKTEEYCHNFFRPGDSDITDQFEVSTNYPLKSRKTVGDIQVEEKRITIGSTPENAIYTKSLLKNKPTDFSWKITDKSSGISIRGEELFPVGKFALWGMKHVISPESFYSFKLRTGEEQSWTRKYTFET